MPSLPDIGLEAAPAFMRATGQAIEAATGSRVTGPIAAEPEHHGPDGKLVARGRLRLQNVPLPESAR